MNENKFEPIIIAFCCHYCAYSAADLAGSMRLQYPPEYPHYPDAVHRQAGGGLFYEGL